MDRVRLAYLDVGQTGVRERLRELSVGERSSDAAGVCLHVGAGRFVHVLVGDHVGDLITQMEITTSTLASGSGMSSM
jgi:hypothetical protein